MNSPERATHPTLGFGAKAGGAVTCCEWAVERPQPATRRVQASKWYLRGRIGFAHIFDMIFMSPLCHNYSPGAARSLGEIIRLPNGVGQRSFCACRQKRTECELFGVSSRSAP